MFKKALLLLLVASLLSGFSLVSYGRNPQTGLKSEPINNEEKKGIVVELIKPEDFVSATIDNKFKTFNKTIVISGRARQNTQVTFEVYSVFNDFTEDGIVQEMEVLRTSETIEVNSLGIFAKEIEIFKGLNKIVIRAIDRERNSQRLERFVILSEVNDIRNIPNRLILGDFARPSTTDGAERNEIKR